MHSALYLIHCISPLHIGCGDDTTVIEAPIARIRSSNMPFIPDSAIKGCWRAHSRNDPNFKHRHHLFGPDRHKAADYAGAVKFTSASLLCMPIRSFNGTFAWVTSPLQLRLFLRDRSIFHRNEPVDGSSTDTNANRLQSATSPMPTLKVDEPDDKTVLIPVKKLDDTKEPPISSSALIVANEKILLEDIDLIGKPSVCAQAWAEFLAGQIYDTEEPEWQQFFQDRFAIVSDDVLQYFIETCTEVRTRIAIDEETGAAKDTSLWTEESMPSESVFWGGIATEKRSYNREGETSIALDLSNFESTQQLQIGGNATLGQGQIFWRLCH